MSVFQLQEWWGLRVCQEDEEFDLSCFAVGNIDNATPPTDKIAVGSQQGILRVYNPTRPQYRIEDLIYEGNLGSPILQVLLGRFIPSNDTLGIALLHPRELAVYELIPQATKEGRVNFHTLQRLYKHDLGLGGKHFTAYNMCHGPYGGSRGRDMILVQSLDGKLQIFEQSANAFSRQLVDCLVPGPITYLPKIDAFITTNHACQAECYRYQVLASSQKDVGVKSSELKESKGEISSSLSMQKLQPTLVEWTANLGETCRQVIVGNFSATDSSAKVSANSEALVVCEKSLFLLKSDTGGVIQQRRLERADASCACAVPVEGSGGLCNLLLAGVDGTVQVYVGFNMTWAARLPTAPVHMAVGCFGGLKGMIVTMDSEGHLGVNYLGTKPPVTAVMTQVRDLDYDKIDQEHRALLQVIRDTQSDAKVEPKEKLLIKSQIAKTFDADPPPNGELPPNLLTIGTGGLGGGDGYMKMAVRLYLSYSGDRPATNVSLVLSTPSHVHVVPKNIVLQKVSGLRATPLVVKLHFYASRSTMPSSSNVTVTASYTSPRGEPRVATHLLSLPLFLSVRPRPPSKSAPCKFVLDTDYPAVPLTELFGDVLHAYQEAGVEIAESIGSNAVQALAFQLQHLQCNPTSTSLASSLVSILVSKNAGRYRLQSESYPGLYLITTELERRLVARLTTSPNANLSVMSPSSKVSNEASAASLGSFLVKLNEPLPLDEFFSLVQEHLHTRTTILSLSSSLASASQQFRLIQKRLLVRYKDRNATPLNGLDLVLREAYERILSVGDQLEAQQGRLVLLGGEIESYAKLLVTLMAMKFSLSAAERSTLQACFCPELGSGREQGWEETATASLTHLVRASFSKNNKDSSAALTATLEIPKSIDSLKKVVNVMLDRLEKGGKIAALSPASTNQPAGNSAPAAPMSNNVKPVSNHK